jgi:hypothetical protein
MTFLRRLWQGKYSLPATFWGFYCAGQIVCVFVSGILLFLSRLVDARPIAFALLFALTFAYWLIASVGVWRSAGAYWTSPIWMRRIWAGAARVVVIAFVAKDAFGLASRETFTMIQRIMADAEF